MLETVYNRYRKQMFALARSFVSNDADAEDAVHEVFAKLASRHMSVLYRLENPEDLRNYLLKATKNTCLNMLKKQRRENPLSDGVLERYGEITDEDFLDRICARTEARDVTAAMLALPDIYRDVLYYHFVLEFSVAEVANATGQKIATVKKQLVRGKKKLLEALNLTGGAVHCGQK